ncbi:MAG: hypothetical protein ACOCWX_06905 [Spirochaetota bacterium]
MQLISQAAVSVISAVLVLAVAVLAFGYELAGSPLTLLGTYMLVMVSIFSIGLVIASLVYFPMLVFSGTTVPFPAFPEVVQRAAVVLPLRWEM